MTLKTRIVLYLTFHSKLIQINRTFKFYVYFHRTLALLTYSPLNSAKLNSSTEITLTEGVVLQLPLGLTNQGFNSPSFCHTIQVYKNKNKISSISEFSMHCMFPLDSSELFSSGITKKYLFNFHGQQLRRVVCRFSYLCVSVLSNYGCFVAQYELFDNGSHARQSCHLSRAVGFPLPPPPTVC